MTGQATVSMNWGNPRRIGYLTKPERGKTEGPIDPSDILMMLFTFLNRRITFPTAYSLLQVRNMFLNRVLVADDDSLFLWALRKELSSHRLTTHGATTGQECLKAVQENRFNLVFLDIHLPDANGLDLMKPIREISPETRVVIISGDGSFQNKERALSEGAAQFLEKPFDISVVTRVVESTLRKFPCKRKHFRYLCNISLRLSILAPSPEEAQFDLDRLSGTINDVGPGGVCVNTEYPLEEGQGVRLRVDADGDPFSKMIPREATAEVVWVVPGGGMSTAGLRFLADPPPLPC